MAVEGRKQEANSRASWKVESRGFNSTLFWEGRVQNIFQVSDWIVAMGPSENADGEMNSMKAVIASPWDKLHLKCLLDILLKISNRLFFSRQQDIWGLQLRGEV